MMLNKINYLFILKVRIFFKRLFNAWFSSQLCLRQRWGNYNFVSGDTHTVPYRVWIRHGALLELNKKNTL